MEEINKFIQGFQRFQHKYFGEHTELFQRLQKKQTPKTLLIGCSDSRVDPALLTDCAPGDLFMVRNVANLVPPYEEGITHQGVSSAIEFAVADLEVSQIIVLGHSGCGGISALMKGRKPKSKFDFVGRWMQIAEPAKQKVTEALHHKPMAAQLRACEMASILISLENLMTFPFIIERMEQGTLAIHGWYFDLKEGALYDFDPSLNRFVPLVGAYSFDSTNTPESPELP
jgi:carbonic anhydrase